MTEDILCEFFRSILRELRERLTPAEFNALIDASASEPGDEK